MLPELLEMERLGLLTPNEAVEANSYSADTATWLRMPAPLMGRLFQAFVLMQYDPHQLPHETLH